MRVWNMNLKNRAGVDTANISILRERGMHDEMVGENGGWSVVESGGKRWGAVLLKVVRSRKRKGMS